MVVLGVDPHKTTHTVVAVDGNGRMLGQLTVKAGAEGFVRMARWAAGFDGARRWGVEDGRTYAGRLVDRLIGAGEEVVWVPPKLMARCRDSARTRGKSDPIDALAVARAVLREPDLQRAQLNTATADVRAVAEHRDDLVAERTRWINRLRVHLLHLDPALEPRPRQLTAVCRLRRLAAELAALPASRRRDVAIDLVARIEADTLSIKALERDLQQLVTPMAPRLLAIRGVGTVTAATLIGHIGDIGRFASAAKLARACGIAPIPVWSGAQTRHRLDRGGNRKLNAAIHQVVLTQIGCHPPAQALYRRRISEYHDTRLGAMRVLKRHLVDVIFTAMTTDAAITAPTAAAA